MPKVFCIGFNKTGTSSLHRFFVDAGLDSAHQTTWPFYSHVNEKDARSYFCISQCYCDGELANFQNLEKWFPRAVFILNTRDERAWIHSRLKHVLRFGEPKSILEVENDGRYGLMAQNFFSDAASAITSWILERRIYEERVRRHFSDNSNFIELSVTESPDWPRHLSAFLFHHNVIKIRPDEPHNIHVNRRPLRNVPDKSALEKYILMADRILSQVDELTAPGSPC